MTNSPGPSSNSGSPSDPAKKKNRRKPRTKPKTSPPLDPAAAAAGVASRPHHSESGPHPEMKLQIQKVKEQQGHVFKVRNKNLPLTPIRLHSFTANHNNLPWICFTKAPMEFKERAETLYTNFRRMNIAAEKAWREAPVHKLSPVRPIKSPQVTEKIVFPAPSVRKAKTSPVRPAQDHPQIKAKTVQANAKADSSTKNAQDNVVNAQAMATIKTPQGKIPNVASAVNVKSTESASNPSKKEKKNNNNKKKNKRLLFPDFPEWKDLDAGLSSRKLFKGVVRINPKNYKEAYVGNEDVSKVDYMIVSVRDRNRALEGDEVLLKFKSEKDQDPNSKYKLVEVVDILEKVHPRTAVGKLVPLNAEEAEFQPRDSRVPRMKIPKIGWPAGFTAQPKMFENVLFLGEMVDWPDVMHATGRLLENLGLCGDLKVESIAILRENNLDVTPYHESIRKCLPTTQKISQKEIDKRVDLRTECIFTIDPATARDLDDAVSCKRLPNDNFEVGVHISDASHYLPEDTELDKIVRHKATTVYTVESVYHMLPVELCYLCSLLPGKDKLSFSVLWEMTPDAEIVRKRIGKTVIKSCSQMSYEQAQSIIENPMRALKKREAPVIWNDFSMADIRQSISNLHALAVKLRNKRVQNGALRIDQVKIGFTLDPSSGKPKSFSTYENKDAHRMIEEFMLLANITVAKHIEKEYPTQALLRLHEPPKQTMLDELRKQLESIGIFVDTSTSGGISSALSKFGGTDFLGQTRSMVLNHLFAKPMMRARYFCSAMETDTSHYALSVDVYTHFTSPIRRYADIVVHRFLAASLGYREKPECTANDIQAIAENCNTQKYNAKKAGEASSDLYLAHYIDEHQPFVEEAVVFDSKERAVDVIVLKTGSVVRVYMNNLGAGVKSTTEEVCDATSRPRSKDAKRRWKTRVVFPATEREPETPVVLEMFSLVRVALKRKPHTNKLEAKLVRPRPQVVL